MLKLKIYPNDNLNIPEMELQADDVVELLNPFLDKIQVDVAKQITAETMLRKRFIKLGVNVKENFKYQKKYYNYCFLAKYLVENNLATWLEYDEDSLDPKKAARLYKNKFIISRKTKEKRIAGRKQFLANLTPEEKKKHFSYLNKENNKKALAAMKVGAINFWSNLTEEKKQEFIAERALKIKDGKEKNKVYPKPIKTELELPFD